MRLATFNILHGRAFDGTPVEAGRLGEACASLEADVLGLQEVDRNQARSGHVDQTAEAARAMGAQWWRFEPAVVGEPGGDWRPATDADSEDAAVAGYGVGLVSRLPVSSWRVIRLPAARVRSPVFVPAGRRFILLRDEPRVALVAEVEAPDGPLLLANTHLSFVPGWNAVQLRRLARALGARGPSGPHRAGKPERPCVVLGDLNLPGPIPGWVSGWRRLAQVPTFPADKPSMQIDHALGYGELPEIAAVAAVRLPLSDHRALVVDLARA